MPQDPRTIAQLKRKIERLEAKVAALEIERQRHFNAYRESLYENVDMRLRIDQAMKIMLGEDE